MILETEKETLEELTGKNISELHDLSISLSEFAYLFWDKTVTKLLGDIERQVECLDSGRRYLGGEDYSADLREV